MSVIERAEMEEVRESVELNLEALLEHCRPLLLGGSLNTFKVAITKNLILVDEDPWTLRPWGKLPPLSLPLGGPDQTWLTL